MAALAPGSGGGDGAGVGLGWGRGGNGGAGGVWRGGLVAVFLGLANLARLAGLDSLGLWMGWVRNNEGTVHVKSCSCQEGSRPTQRQAPLTFKVGELLATFKKGTENGTGVPQFNPHPRYRRNKS